MTATPWAIRKQGVLLLVDHDLAPEGEHDYHMWVILPGWRGRPVTVRRDWLGRGVTDSSIGQDWLIVTCNNGSCNAAAAVRLSTVALTVSRLLPEPEVVTP